MKKRLIKILAYLVKRINNNYRVIDIEALRSLIDFEKQEMENIRIELQKSYSQSQDLFNKISLTAEAIEEKIEEKIEERKEQEAEEELLIDKDLSLEHIDENILSLVKLINDMPGLYTIDSCGGHKEATGSQSKDGNWYIYFKIDRHYEQGFASLGYLTYFFNTYLVSNGFDVRLHILSRKHNNLDPISSLLVKIESNQVPSDLIYRMLRDMIEFEFDSESLEQAIIEQKEEKKNLPF